MTVQGCCQNSDWRSHAKNPNWSQQPKPLKRQANPPHAFGFAGSAGFAERIGTYLYERAPLPNLRNMVGIRGLASLPTLDIKLGSLNVPDLVGRSMTWLIYIPQGLMAVAYIQKPVETWVRNLSAWFGTTALLEAIRNPKSGLNPILNTFMLPRAPLPKPLADAKGFGRFVALLKNPLMIRDWIMHHARPSGNYLQLYKESLEILGRPADKSLEKLVDFKKLKIPAWNLDKAVRATSAWSVMDVNERYFYDIYANRLKSRLAQLTHPLQKSPLLKKLNAIQSVSTRIIGLKFLSTAMAMLIMGILIGIFIPRLIFKYLSPIDRKLEATKNKFKSAASFSSEAPRSSQSPPLNNFYKMPPPSSIKSTAWYPPASYLLPTPAWRQGAE